MLNYFSYNKIDGRLASSNVIQGLHQVLKEESSYIWADIGEIADDEIDLLTNTFKFHPLAIEDCIFPVERPKLDEYGSYIFLVINSIEYDKENEVIYSPELRLFLGDNYIISVHDKNLDCLAAVKDRCRQSPELMAKGPDFLLHAIVDTLVDNYFPVLNKFDDRIELIEDAIFSRVSEESFSRIFFLRKEIAKFRIMISPQRELLRRISHRTTPFIKDSTVVYFRDVYDHLIRANIILDNYRDLLTSVLEAYHSITSKRLNEIMKTLSIVSTIMLPLTLISGIYGMNFKFMPELFWQYGYYSVLVVMVLIAVSLLAFFKVRKWF